VPDGGVPWRRGDDQPDVAARWSDLEQPPDPVSRDDDNKCAALFGRAAPQPFDQVQARGIHEARLHEVENKLGAVKLDLAVRVSPNEIDGRHIDLTPYRDSRGAEARLSRAHGGPLDGSQPDPFRRSWLCRRDG
jgi:hypothetical protein